MATFQALAGRLSVLDLFQPGTALRGLLCQLESTMQSAKEAPTLDTEGTPLLASSSRPNVRALCASLPSDQLELVLTIPAVVVSRTEVRVAPDNEVRATLTSSGELLIRHREAATLRCIEVDVQLVEH